MSVSLREKKYVLRGYLNVDNEEDDLMEKSKEFQSFGPRNEKDLSPLDFSQDFGIVNNSWA